MKTTQEKSAATQSVRLKNEPALLQVYVLRQPANQKGIDDIDLSASSPLSDTAIIAGKPFSESSYREFLVSKIKEGDAPTIAALNQAKRSLVTNGKVNLICPCASSPCHGHVVGKIVAHVASHELNRELTRLIGEFYQQELPPALFGKPVLGLDNLGREYKCVYTEQNGWRDLRTGINELQIIAFRPTISLKLGPRIGNSYQVVQSDDYCVVRSASADKFELMMAGDVLPEQHGSIVFQGTPRECYQWRESSPRWRTTIEQATRERILKESGLEHPNKTSSVALTPRTKNIIAT